MKFKTRRALVPALVCLTLACCVVTGALAADKKDKPKTEQAIDSGSFGIFIKGHRVATETFQIEQENGNSIIKSQLKGIDASDATSQKSDLALGPSGELLRYEWSQSSGGSLSVFPDKDFLKMRITAPNSSKAAEQPFLLPSTAPILDNNFFVHREVLAWKYLNAVCKASGGDTKCSQEPASFGALVPQDRTSMSIRMELVGKEKISFHGTERELMKLNLLGETYQWSLWVDDQDHFKLMRVAIPADDTVVDRD